MSESRVHPVISRYSFAREVTRLRESRALSLSGTRKERTERKRDARSEVSSKTPRSKWWQHGGARRRLPRRRERARLYREEESRGNTWKDRVIYCYGRLQHGVLVVCGCQGKEGDTRGGLRFGRILFPSLAACPLPCPPCPCVRCTLCRALRYLYKYRYQAFSLFLGTITQPLEGTTILGLPPRAPYLLYHVLCQGPSVAYVCNGPPTPGIPRWVSNTYLHGRAAQLYPSG